jgi:biotin operon repressor
MSTKDSKNEQPCTLHSVRRSYLKISELDVVNVIMRTAYNWQGCGVISPSNIAHLLKTSRYQVDKHVKTLKNEGLVEYKSVMIGSEEDYYPPYNGYKLSKQGEITYSKELKELEERERKLIHECFGV